MPMLKEWCSSFSSHFNTFQKVSHIDICFPKANVLMVFFMIKLEIVLDKLRVLIVEHLRVHLFSKVGVIEL